MGNCIEGMLKAIQGQGGTTDVGDAEGGLTTIQGERSDVGDIGGGLTVEVKRAMSTEEQHKSGLRTEVRSSNRGGDKTQRIFVGGLPATVTEQEFHQYFEFYGHVTQVEIMFDQITNRHRGFGFVTFANEDAVVRVLTNPYHILKGKTVEVKNAVPRYGGRVYDSLSNNNGGFMGYGGGYGPQAYPYALGYGGYGVVNYAMMGMGAGYNVKLGAYGNPNVTLGNHQYGGSGAAAAYVDNGYEFCDNQSSNDGGDGTVSESERVDDYAGSQVGHGEVHSEQAQHH